MKSYLIYLLLLFAFLACEQKPSKRDVRYWQTNRQAVEASNKVLINYIIDGHRFYLEGSLLSILKNSKGDSLSSILTGWKAFESIKEKIEDNSKTYRDKSILYQNFEGCYDSLSVIYNYAKVFLKDTSHFPVLARENFKNSYLAFDLAYISHLENIILRTYLKGVQETIDKEVNFTYHISKRVYLGDTLHVETFYYDNNIQRMEVVIEKDTFQVDMKNPKLSIPSLSKEIGKDTLKGFIQATYKNGQESIEPIYFQVPYEVIPRKNNK